MSLLDSFHRGYRRFFRKYFWLKRSMYHELVKNGQSPKAVVIACSDSRVDPAIITGASPGDIFSVRNVANLVPAIQCDKDKYYATASALEFAIKVLQVENIVVQGHSHCAGIKTLLQHPDERTLPTVATWVDIGSAAREKVLASKADKSEEELLDMLAKESVLGSLKNLLTYDFIKERVDAGKVHLHGWYFDLDSGHLYDYNFDKKEFQCIL